MDLEHFFVAVQLEQAIETVLHEHDSLILKLLGLFLSPPRYHIVPCYNLQKSDLELGNWLALRRQEGKGLVAQGFIVGERVDQGKLYLVDHQSW